MGKKDQKNNWYRLMAGLYLTFDSVYPAGSEPMVRHLEKIQAGFKKVIDQPQLHPREPQQKPVIRHLPNALKMGMYYNESPIYHTIGLMAHHLTWEYGYDQMAEDLAENYAYTEIIGPRGPVVCNQMIVGMVLLGPSCHYPSHRHPNVEESYICLGGHVAYNDIMVLTTNSFILVQKNHPHWLATDEQIPSLLVYAWTGEPQELDQFKMEMD